MTFRLSASFHRQLHSLPVSLSLSPPSLPLLSPSLWRERLAVINSLHGPISRHRPPHRPADHGPEEHPGIWSRDPETDAVEAAWLFGAYFDCPLVPSLLVVS